MYKRQLCAERGRCLLRIFTVNLEVTVLGKADNRFGMGFLDGIVGGLRFKRQYAQLFYHAMLDVYKRQTQLSADGVNFVRKSSKKLGHHVIEINKLIADRINLSLIHI